MHQTYRSYRGQQRQGALIFSFLLLLLLSIMNVDLKGDNFITGKRLFEDKSISSR